MNCLAIEQGEDIVVVDCGVSFPHDDLGLDVLHPDFTWLFERADRVRGIFLTHGHEDHIGAVPYMMKGLRAPLWGPPHAVGLVKRRLQEHGYASGSLDLRIAEPGSTYAVGSFGIEPIRVAHSIVEASALCVRTRAGNIVHTGDFNFDPAPPDGEATDEKRLLEIGAEGVGLLLSDSTNIDVSEKKIGEADVGETLRRIIESADQRVFVSLFASNIQRLILLGHIARQTNRKLLLLGRSLTLQVDVATSIRRLNWPSGLVVSAEQARQLPPRELLVLAGGTQGERQSAMARLAAGVHPDLEIVPGDLVVLSSRAIPGNERTVSNMMSEILRRGARLHTRVTEPGVHTSGHATRAEQRKMIDLTRPRCFLPVHGTLHHLMRHADLAREAGVQEVLVVENGSVVRFDGARLLPDGRVQAGIVPIGIGGMPVPQEVLRERLDLARCGTATVSLALDHRGRVVAGPELDTRGIAGVDERGGEKRAILVEIARTVEDAARRRLSEEELKDEIRRLVRRELERLGGAKPHVLVQLLIHDD